MWEEEGGNEKGEGEWEEEGGNEQRRRGSGRRREGTSRGRGREGTSERGRGREREGREWGLLQGLGRFASPLPPHTAHGESALPLRSVCSQSPASPGSQAEVDRYHKLRLG